MLPQRGSVFSGVVTGGCIGITSIFVVSQEMSKACKKTFQLLCMTILSRFTFSNDIISLFIIRHQGTTNYSFKDHLGTTNYSFTDHLEFHEIDPHDKM